MHTIPAIEVKRRGVIAIEEALQNGPVHIIKNNRIAFVALSEEDYVTLTQQPKLQKLDLWDLLKNRPWKGTRTKKDIKHQILGERKS